LPAETTAPPSGEVLDPRRWIALALVCAAALIVVLDNTVLSVAIPTILRELHTELPSLQWVLTGYALTFATLLIIGGRLCDIYGARRMFIIGCGVFASGSLLASAANSVPVLLLGESLIEGMGASLMLPATLALLSSTFTGHERVKAFAIWGTVVGSAVAFGPLLGGFLTTNYSWRWAFRINVVVAPLTAIGTVLLVRPSPRSERRQRIDLPGAALIAVGTFLLVFGLSEGPRYGWWAPIRAFTVVGSQVWPADAAVSLVPILFVVALGLLTAFYRLERAKERADRDPLFEFGELEKRSFRWGLLTTAVLAMGQLGFLFVLPVFLQEGKHLTAVENGLWLVPSGAFIVLGAQLGAVLARRVDVTVVVRWGLLLEVLGLLAMAWAMQPELTFWDLMPGYLLFGIGVGFASSQLTNVVLAEITPERAGAASGANSTVRQIGAALGVAVMSTVLTTFTTRNAVDAVAGSSLPGSLRLELRQLIERDGVGFQPPGGLPASTLARLDHLITRALADGARPALLFAGAVVGVGAACSLLIPKVGGGGQRASEGDEVFRTIDPLEALDGVDTS
jgi:EmrB/QacA subfamily drug resistance transporter